MKIFDRIKIFIDNVMHPETRSILNKIKFIIKTAKKLEDYSKNENLLFESLNKIKKSELEKIIEEININENNFGPVILLRHKVAKLLLEGKWISPKNIEKIKNKFINKDLHYFEDYPEKIKNMINNYKSKKSPYYSFRNNFRIFYVFFYNQNLKNKIDPYLIDIAKFIDSDLDLTGFEYKIRNFNWEKGFGPAKFWMIFYPAYYRINKDKYNLYLAFDYYGVEYGIKTGSMYELELYDPDINSMPINYNKDLLSFLGHFNKYKEIVILENKKLAAMNKLDIK
jgi:hypothetical protein